MAAHSEVDAANGELWKEDKLKKLKENISKIHEKEKWKRDIEGKCIQIINWVSLSFHFPVKTNKNRGKEKKQQEKIAEQN